MSLVKGQPLRPQLNLITRFMIGFLASATVAFSALGALGRSMFSVLPTAQRSYFVALIFFLTAVFDLGDVIRRRNYSRLSWQRQTPKRIATDLGMRRAALAWGLDAGLGFTTYRVTSMYWLVVAFALVGLAPWWIGTAYALGFLAPLALGWFAALAVSGSSPTVRASEIASAHIRGARLLAFLLLCASIVGFVALLTGV